MASEFVSTHNEAMSDELSAFDEAEVIGAGQEFRLPFNAKAFRIAPAERAVILAAEEMRDRESWATGIDRLFEAVDKLREVRGR
jgi:hypothetical protein